MTKFPNINDTNYFTNRALENEKGETSGKIIMWRIKGEEEYRYVLKCPFCGHDQEKKEAFTRRPYRPRCDNCGKSIAISKIKKKK
ncbi:MAG: hypothetical protein V1718_00325 [archaeon]